MCTNHEAWIASNTKFCHPMHMRLTPTACEAMKNRKGELTFGESYTIGKPSACATCPGLQDAPPSSSAGEWRKA